MPSWGGAAKGGATGAAIGSVVPGIGTIAGGGVGALIGGLFGKKKDPHADALGGASDHKPGELNYDSITAKIQKLSDQRLQHGGAMQDQGADALGAVNDYFKKLAGGDAASVLSATSASRGRVIDQYDVARQNAAAFSPKGGGTTAASAMSRVAEANQLSDLTSEAQTTGMDRLAKLGIDVSQLGLGEDQLGSHDLDTLISAVMGEKQLDAQKSIAKSQTTAGLASGLGQLLGLFLTRDKAAA